MARERKKDEGLYVLFFAFLVVGYQAAKLAAAELIDAMHGPETIRLSLDGIGRWAGGNVDIQVGFAASLISFAFCLFFARDVGFHRRDAMWAAIPSLIAPYFLFKIAWRVANLPGNRYWDMPNDPDPFRVGTPARDKSDSEV